MTDHPATPEQSLMAAFRAVALVGLMLTIAGTTLVSWRVGTEVAIGAALGCANFWLLGRAVTNALGGEAASLPWSLLALFKFTALVAVAYLLVRAGVAVMPLFVGLGAVPLGIVASSLRSVQSLRT